MENQTVTIGEMAKLFHLSVQTLQYYDKIGLFAPECRGENNYRLYRFEQCYQLAAICHMRQMGYPLKTIARIMDERNVETSLAQMETQRGMLRREMERLAGVDRALARKMHFIESERASPHFGKTEVRAFPVRYYLPIGAEETLYGDESFYLNPTLVFYHGETRSFGAYLEGQAAAGQWAGKSGVVASAVPAGPYLCAYHMGSYETILEHTRTLRQAYAHLALGEWSVHFNIVDQFVEKVAAHFVTRIEIPVEEWG